MAVVRDAGARGGSRRRTGWRLVGLWKRSRRRAILAARSHQTRERRIAPGGVDVSHRRCVHEPKAGRGDRVRSNAALCRRNALSQHAARTRHRARSCYRPATLGFRREVAARHGLRRFRQPRRLDMAAGRRAAHLRRDRSTRGSSRSTPARASPSPASAIEASSIYARDCGSRRRDSPTTRSPRRRRLSATRSSSAPALRTAPRSRIRAAKCAASTP